MNLWGKSEAQRHAERMEALARRDAEAKKRTPEALGARYGKAADLYFGTDIPRPPDAPLDVEPRDVERSRWGYSFAAGLTALLWFVGVGAVLIAIRSIT